MDIERKRAIAQKFALFLHTNDALINFISAFGSGRVTDYAVKHNTIDGFTALIDNAFTWRDTAEGQDYWESLNIQWIQYFRDNRHKWGSSKTPKCVSIW